MSDQSSSTPPAGGAPPAPPAPVGSGASGIGDLTSHPPAPATHEPITQAKPDWRSSLPVWMKQLPQFRFPPPNPDFQLIDHDKLMVMLKDADPATIKRIEDDMHFMDHELLRFFRDRDYEA